MVGEFLGGGSEEELFESGASPGSHHDEVGFFVFKVLVNSFVYAHRRDNLSGRPSGKRTTLRKIRGDFFESFFEVCLEIVGWADGESRSEPAKTLVGVDRRLVNVDEL